MRRTLLVLLVAAALLPTSSAFAANTSSHPTSATSGVPEAVAGSARGSVPPGASKLLVFVVENHSMTQMKEQMPWTYRFAQRYGYATRYFATTHPSLPNYLAIAGGSTFGVTDDAFPSAHPLKGHSVFGLARRAGLSAHLYAEHMPANCALTSSGTYAVKHNPWPYFVDERSGCHKQDTSMATYRHDVRHGHLPAAGMVVPDLCNDAHDCSLATADSWLKKRIELALSGSDFQHGKLAIVVTADEDDRSEGNKVLTVLAQRGVHHVVTHTRLSHLALCRLYTQILGVDPLRQADQAHSMARAFGLRLRRS